MAIATTRATDTQLATTSRDGEQRGDKRRNGSKSEPEQGRSIDWERLRIEVLSTVAANRSAAGRYAKQHERAVESGSLADAVHEVVTELLATHAEGGEGFTQRELKALALLKVERRWHAWQKRARQRQKNLERYARTLKPADLFEVICARDEQHKLFAKMYDALADQPEARLLLYVLLKQGIPFRETAVLAELLGCSRSHVTNMKRRLVTLARNTMADLAATKTGAKT